MHTKLKNIGSGVALILDPPVCAALKLYSQDEVEVELRGDSLIMHSVEQPTHNKVADAFQRVINTPHELASHTKAETETKQLSRNSEEFLEFYI